jgi:hypothetical protein
MPATKNMLQKRWQKAVITLAYVEVGKGKSNKRQISASCMQFYTRHLTKIMTGTSTDYTIDAVNTFVDPFPTHVLSEHTCVE